MNRGHEAGGAQGPAAPRACLTTFCGYGCETPAWAPCAWPLTGWPLRICWARLPTTARASSYCATGLSCLRPSTSYLPPAMCQGSSFPVASRRYVLHPAIVQLGPGSLERGVLADLVLVHYPFQAQNRISRVQNLIQTLVSGIVPATRSRTSPQALVLDTLCLLLDILVPKLRPVSASPRMGVVGCWFPADQASDHS